MEFGLYDGLVRQGNLLYVPFKGMQEDGYLFLDGYGVPVWCAQADEYNKRYGLGSRKDSSVFIECYKAIMPVVTARIEKQAADEAYVVWEFLLDGWVDTTCDIKYSFTGGCYTIESLSWTNGLADGYFYHMPDAQLAKYYMMARSVE